MIADVGFQRVKVLEESHFAIESVSNDPTAEVIFKKSGLSPGKVAGTANSVVSVKVSAFKPES
jgi:hypothetical protein